MASSINKTQKGKIISPGATIGILGGGQLGRMLAQAALRLDYHVIIYTNEAHSPACEVASDSIVASFDDQESLRKFAERVDVVSVEFENIPANALEFLASIVPVSPNPSVLHTFQNRLREKAFLTQNKLPCAPYAKVNSIAELREALQKVGIPSILKTGGFGYDGKGQIKIASEDHAEQLLSKPITEEMVLEAFVNFECEVSIIVAKSISGEFNSWGLIRNIHTNHILDFSSVPAEVDPKIEQKAKKIALTIVEKSGAVGVICVEFFLTKENSLLVNEIAPRVHNSGHLTIEASYTSQFEQHIRAICGLPLGSTEYIKPAAMANVLGELWRNGEPLWKEALKLPHVNLHLYGKNAARPGRKMGHLTALADTPMEARNLIKDAREKLIQEV